MDDDEQRDEEQEPSAPAPSGPSGAEGHAGGVRKKTVTGALVAGIALGLRDVFEPEHHDRIAIEQPAPEQPEEPQTYEIHLDPVAPESSFAIYRPWLEGEAEEDPEAPPPAVPPPADPRPRGGGMGALGG